METIQLELKRPVEQAALEILETEILETMFFDLPVEEVEAAQAQAGALCAVARVSRTGSGSLTVSLDPAPLARRAASFPGLEEEELTEGASLQMIREFANMVCGSTLSRLAPRGRFSISSPETVSASEVSHSPWLRFPLECGSLSISLTYRGL